MLLAVFSIRKTKSWGEWDGVLVFDLLPPSYRLLEAHGDIQGGRERLRSAVKGRLYPVGGRYPARQLTFQPEAVEATPTGRAVR